MQGLQEKYDQARQKLTTFEKTYPSLRWLDWWLKSEYIGLVPVSIIIGLVELVCFLINGPFGRKEFFAILAVSFIPAAIFCGFIGDFLFKYYQSFLFKHYKTNKIEYDNLINTRTALRVEFHTLEGEMKKFGLLN